MQPAAVTSSNDVAVARLYGFGQPEFLVLAASGAKRELTGQRFVYGGEARALEAREREDLGVPVPAGARLFVAESGRSIDEVQQTWLGWTDAAGLHLVDAWRKGPTAVPVADGDLLAVPPVLVASGRLNAFVFHPQGGAAALLRHEATGVPQARPTVKTDSILSLPSMPKLAASACVPRVRTRDVAIVSWVESGARSCRLGVAVVNAASAAATPATVDIAGLKPVGGRLALQMTPMIPSLDDAGRPPSVQIAFLAEQLERTGYAIVRADFDVKASQFHVETTPLELPTTPPLHSAYVWRARDVNDTRVRVYALREDGVLLLWKDGGVRSKRAGVSLDYAFPIEPDNIEPRVTTSGDIELAPIRWDR